MEANELMFSKKMFKVLGSSFLLFIGYLFIKDMKVSAYEKSMKSKS